MYQILKSFLVCAILFSSFIKIKTASYHHYCIHPIATFPHPKHPPRAVHHLNKAASILNLYVTSLSLKYVYEFFERFSLLGTSCIEILFIRVVSSSVFEFEPYLHNIFTHTIYCIVQVIFSHYFMQYEKIYTTFDSHIKIYPKKKLKYEREK